jgi:DNA topoisomerase IA
MSKALIIVESPTKAKTIGKFLGRDYTVISSMGHIRDLPKSKIGVDAAYKTSPYDVIELTDIMHTLLTDSNMHTYYTELGLKRSLDFDWNNTGKQVYEILSK